MSGFSTTILIILGIICRIHTAYNAAKSHSQSAPIVSGNPAQLGQFPWHVVMISYDIDTDDYDICGGSILSEIWILTAAHCIDELETVVMSVGTIELNNTPIILTSEELYIHPDYDSVRKFNDIALIKLPTALDFSDNIKTIDLVNATEVSNDFIGVQGTICGFGTTTEGSKEPSAWLLWTTIEIVNKSICDEAYHENTPNTVMCGKGWNGTNQSPCLGDSGGALVWRKDQNAKFVQIGIISYAKRNCSQYPVGYTRITSFLDYIHDITNLKWN